MPHRHALSLTVASALLAGCALPVPKIGGAGYAPDDSLPLDHEPASMAESLRKLNHVRAAYEEAIRRQRSDEQAATSGLVVLGTAIMGLAIGKASHGWIVGSALVGGTAYGLARTQLDARQVELWEQGIEALDCARQASLPLDLGADRRGAIEQALVPLRQAQDAVGRSAVDLRKQVDRVGRAQVARPELVDQALHGAEAAQAAADTAAMAARTLLDTARGRALSTTVDRVVEQVTRATNDIAVDVSSVKPLVAGVGGYAAIFVPGIDASLGSVFDKYKATRATMSVQSGKVGNAVHAAPPPPVDPLLQQALDALAGAMADLAQRQAAVKALLSTADTGAVDVALNACHIPGLSTTPVLTPASLDFTEKTAGSQGVAIAGGTPPYEADVLDPVANALVAGNMKDGRFVVNAAATLAAGTYTVLVNDSSTSHRTVPLLVHVNAVGPAPAPTPPAPAPKPAAQRGSPPVITRAELHGSTPPTSPTPPTPPTPPKPPTPLTPSADGTPSASTNALWDRVVAAMRGTPPIPVAGSSVSVLGVQREGQGARVLLACSPPGIDPVASNQKTVRDALSARDKEDFAQLMQDGTIDRLAPQLVLSFGTSCVKR